MAESQSQIRPTLQSLAGMVGRKNAVERHMAEVIGRPAEKGHFGEFVAARIFDIKLHGSAAHKGSDGVFRGAPDKGKSVNIKFYGVRDGLLDLKEDDGPHYYLVMTGPKAGAVASCGKSRPWVIESVFIFEASALLRELKARNPKKNIGVATSVPVDLWDAAEIYPNGESPRLRLSDERREMLRLFSAAAIG